MRVMAIYPTERAFYEGLKRAGGRAGVPMLRLETWRKAGLPDVMYFRGGEIGLLELKVCRRVKPPTYKSVWALLSPAQQEWHARRGAALHHSHIAVWAVGGIAVLASRTLTARQFEVEEAVAVANYQAAIHRLCSCINGCDS